MAYSKAKLKSNGNKASPCFKPFLIGNISDKILTHPDSAVHFSQTKHDPYHFILWKQTKESAHFSCCRWACLLLHNSWNQDVNFETSTPFGHSTLNSAKLFVLKKKTTFTQTGHCKWHQSQTSHFLSFYTLIQNAQKGIYRNYIFQQVSEQTSTNCSPMVEMSVPAVDAASNYFLSQSNVSSP
jgi:hypothetical protein